MEHTKKKRSLPNPRKKFWDIGACRARIFAPRPLDGTENFGGYLHKFQNHQTSIILLKSAYKTPT